MCVSAGCPQRTLASITSCYLNTRYCWLMWRPCVPLTVLQGTVSCDVCVLMQDKEKLKQRLLLAIENSKGFGLQVGTGQSLFLDIHSHILTCLLPAVS